MSFEIVNYSPALTPQLVDVINRALTPLRALPRLNPEGPELGIYTHADLMRRFRDELVDQDLSYAALVDGRPIAVAECRMQPGQNIAGLGWVATHPAYTGKGLARRCVEACIDGVRARGATQIRTLNIIDSRWTEACSFLDALGFAVEDAEHRNVTMQIDIRQWDGHAPVLPEGYTLTTYKPGDADEWARLKNEIFGDSETGQYFLDNFAARHDFDPRGWFFAEHGGRKVGMTAGMICRSRLTGAVIGGQVHWVGTLAEARGLGIGEALVVAALNYLKALDADPCILETQPFRTAAVHLYEKLGFRMMRAQRTYVREL